MSVTLSEVKRAARAHRAPLAGESAGYLVLAIADQVLQAPRLVQATDIQLTEDGTLRMVSGHASSDADAELSLRRALDQLLLVASSGSAALTRASRRTEPLGLSSLVRELEAALIPVNRSAARRALARVHRETARALESGVLPEDEPSQSAAPMAPSAVAAPMASAAEAVPPARPVVAAPIEPAPRVVAAPIEPGPRVVAESIALPVVAAPIEPASRVVAESPVRATPPAVAEPTAPLVVAESIALPVVAAPIEPAPRVVAESPVRAAPPAVAEPTAPPAVAESTAPLAVAELTAPLVVAESTAPPAVAESTAPLAVAESTAPLAVAELTAPPAVAESTAPLAVAESTAPLAVAESTAPLAAAEQVLRTAIASLAAPPSVGPREPNPEPELVPDLDQDLETPALAVAVLPPMVESYLDGVVTALCEQLPAPPQFVESDALTSALAVGPVSPPVAEAEPEFLLEEDILFEEDIEFEIDAVDSSAAPTVMRAVEVEPVTIVTSEVSCEPPLLDLPLEARTRPEPVVLRKALRPLLELLPKPFADSEPLPRTPTLGSLATELPNLAPEQIAEMSMAAALAAELAAETAQSSLRHEERTQRMPDALLLLPGVAMVESKKSDVTELLRSFQVAEQNENPALCRAIKEMAELDLTPAPFGALIR